MAFSLRFRAKLSSLRFRFLMPYSEQDVSNWGQNKVSSCHLVILSPLAHKRGHAHHFRQISQDAPPFERC